MFPFIGAP